MTHSSLKERFARRGHIRVIDRVSSGSPVDLVLRVAGELSAVRVIDAVRALVKRGATTLKAKRALEAMIEFGEGALHVPLVEDPKALALDLKRAGVRAARVVDDTVDVAALRQRLGLTQEQFSVVYRLSLRSLQNWEQGQQPDQTANTYLLAISSRPDEVAKALQVELA
jgi:putative transcriptional regulator